MEEKNGKITFAPQLYIPRGVRDISFYKDALGAEERRRWTNDDGTIHVAELAVGDAVFHLHEETDKAELFSPAKHRGTTTIIGLFVPDVDMIMSNAVAAGATEISPAKSYDYGYRQGEIKDPFGHHWLIQMAI